VGGIVVALLPVGAVVLDAPVLAGVWEVEVLLVEAAGDCELPELAGFEGVVVCANETAQTISRVNARRCMWFSE
jgi:hypothetical protein